MTEVKRADGTRSFLTYDKAHRVTELRHVDKKDKLISSYTYEYDDGNYITKESINQDGKTVVHAYSYDTLGQVETMTVSDKAGKELSKLSYTYDLAGNKLTSTESIDGKEEKTTFSYDDNNRLTKLENKDGITTYTYDKNGNRTASKKNDEKLDYIYDTENRLLAVKDKEGLLMAALYDGDDNRVFMASRKEGKNTYQLFSRKPKDKGKSGRKSPYTAPNGEENSLFWYGFSQNILQSLSALPQTIGSIWHEIFDDISTAYHQKVAKDRATKEGLVVNPPDLDNLPGEGEVTYASQVQDVLIPYTTREDTYHYYEERNYVNDINREYTEVLQTYDHDLKARETYTYGNGRASYLDNQEDTNYNYLTNQSGSVTGLTQDGEVVASSTYHLYGSTKETTDTTGNPYAYNGEARDVTGLDYLRARYYDSQAGTFLTEDSYPGELTTPLTQNGYAYVSNNPVNYTDPSGHFFKKLLKGAGKLLTKAKNAVVNFAKNTARAVVNVAKKAYNIGRNIVNTVVNTAKGVVNWAGTQINNAKNWAVNQWNNFQRTPVYQGAQQVYQSANHYAQQQQAQARAQAEQRRQQHIRDEYSQSTGIKTTPKTREAKSLFRNWGKALKEMYTHVCKTAKRVKKQVANYVKKIDWKKVVKTSAYIAGEFFSVNDIYRVITGKDPLTGEKASRLEAAAWLTADLLTMGGSKAAKVAKVASKANKVADTVKASKAVSKVNKAIDAGKTFVKSGINKVLDTPIGFSRQVAMAGGPAMDIGGPTLREAGQYVQKGWDNMVQAFAKNGDEVVEGTSKGSKGAPPPNLSPEGAGRKGAFNEAKRKNGIPTSQNPDRVGPNLDKRGNRQPGRSYEFDRIQDGETVTVTIRDDAGGHVYKDDPSQNRGPHFNDDGGNHYDY
ncbi:Cell wall-associated polypeptide CWBP200 [Streptococcus suis]|nr:RHS repeat-associated core domain-containing protein [Streptococcus suis]CYV19277.1 Cell wall-associated polypeptide CWBP200 [Streptococcus suis]